MGLLADVWETFWVVLLALPLLLLIQFIMARARVTLTEVFFFYFFERVSRSCVGTTTALELDDTKVELSDPESPLDLGGVGQELYCVMLIVCSKALQASVH